MCETSPPCWSRKEEQIPSLLSQSDFPHARDKPQPDNSTRDSYSGGPERIARARHAPEIDPICSQTRTADKAQRIRRRPLDSPIANCSESCQTDGLSSRRVLCPPLRHLLAGTLRTDWNRRARTCEHRPSCASGKNLRDSFGRTCPIQILPPAPLANNHRQ